jgi:hypothetical protein
MFTPELQHFQSQQNKMSMSHEQMSGAYLRNAADDDLDKQAEWIKALVARLLELINKDDAKSWEQAYQITDLAEELRRLKRELRNSRLIGDPDASRDVISALEVAQERAAEQQHAKILQLEAELRLCRDALQREKSKNWDLTYQCQDLREEVWRLTMHLGHSITIGDWEEGRLVPKTTRERALEDRVGGLEKRVRELDDRAQTMNVKIGHADGTGRVRSRSM